MLKRTAQLFAVAAFLLASQNMASAVGGYLDDFNLQYGTTGTALDTCTLCHNSPSGGTRNTFGANFASATIGNHSFNATLEARDSDADGFSNIAEITARTFPGNAASSPAPVPPPPPPADTTAPAVTGFAIPATSSSLTVSITTFTATDATGVTGYRVTESASAPLAGAAGWTASAPASYTFASAGAKTLYGWAKDAAGNVSAGASAGVTITLPAPPPVPTPTPTPTPPPSSETDRKAPRVTEFDIPEHSSSLTVPIAVFTATDNVGVTAYLVTEVESRPNGSESGWTATIPDSYTFSSPGKKKLNAWAKDAAGNVSTKRQKEKVHIRLVDPNAIPLPTGQETFVYDAAGEPVMSSVPSEVQPIGVILDSETVTLTVGVGTFVERVDAYLTMAIAPADGGGVVTEEYYLNRRGDFKLLSGDDDDGGDVKPWKKRVVAIREMIWDQEPLSNLTPGTYTFTLTVQPRDEENAYYDWTTTVIIP